MKQTLKPLTDKGFRNLVIAILVFFAVWTLIGPTYELQSPYSSAIVKILVWIVAPYLYLKYVDKVNPLEYMKLTTSVKRGLTWGVVSSIIYFIGASLYFIYLEKRSPDFQLYFDTWLNTVILVGLTEEIAFRGFLLPKLTEYFAFWKANLIQAILFVLIHVPIWFALPEAYHPSGTIGEYVFSVVFILVFALLAGWLVRKTDSLWSVILLHSTVDYNTSIFVGEWGDVLPAEYES